MGRETAFEKMAQRVKKLTAENERLSGVLSHVRDTDRMQAERDYENELRESEASDEYIS